MAVGEGIVVGEISSLLRRIGSFKDTVEHRIGQALVIDRLLDHHTSPAEGPVPGAGRTKTSCPEFIYGQDVLQLVEKATLLRQAAYEQSLWPRSPRTARDYFK